MPILRRQQRRHCRSCSIMYVCLHFTILLPNILQAMCVHGLHGISVSGIILGANLVAPSTVLHPSFFGPEPKFVNVHYGVHRKSNNIFSQQLYEFILLLLNISYSTDILQQDHCTQISSEKLMPLLHHQFLPLQCLPCCFLLLEVVFVTQHAPAIHQPCTHHPPPPPPPALPSPPPHSTPSRTTPSPPRPPPSPTLTPPTIPFLPFSPLPLNSP